MGHHGTRPDVRLRNRRRALGQTVQDGAFSKSQQSVFINLLHRPIETAPKKQSLLECSISSAISPKTVTTPLHQPGVKADESADRPKPCPIPRLKRFLRPPRTLRHSGFRSNSRRSMNFAFLRRRSFRGADSKRRATLPREAHVAPLPPSNRVHTIAARIVPDFGKS